ERTRYSVPASYANRPVSLRVYADRLVVAAEGTWPCSAPSSAGLWSGSASTPTPARESPSIRRPTAEKRSLAPSSAPRCSRPWRTIPTRPRWPR
ncbi:hypothetical protein CDO81_15065, partial [Roseateles puraquae]